MWTTVTTCRLGEVHPSKRSAKPLPTAGPASCGPPTLPRQSLGYQGRNDFHHVDLLRAPLSLPRRHSPPTRRQNLVVKSGKLLLPLDPILYLGYEFFGLTLVSASAAQPASEITAI